MLASNTGQTAPAGTASARINAIVARIDLGMGIHSVAVISRFGSRILRIRCREVVSPFGQTVDPQPCRWPVFPIVRDHALRQGNVSLAARGNEGQRRRSERELEQAPPKG